MRYFLLLTTFCLFQVCFAQHTVVLKSGDKIDCVVLSLNDDMWTVYHEREERKISMKEVSSIFFKEYVPYDGTLVDGSEETEIVVNGFTVRYQIKDRKLERNPKVSIGSEDKGIVVVKVTVDRYGNILSAEAGQPGSNTSNKYLYIKAETAAKTAKFDQNLKGPLKTEGTITIVY